MISICIPIYNYDVRELVYTLHKQADELMIPFEIRLIDDASDVACQEKNRELLSLSNVIYKEEYENTGRVAIRNKLAEEATFRYLIFMDCDAEICLKNFVKRYVEVCSPEIVCVGGNKYSDTPPASEYYLHWLYGSKREAIDVHTRNKKPNGSFKTFNFLIDKEIFKKVRFDDKLTEYGHEDTLFGIELFRHDIKVTHIDNPLIHAGLETTPVFLDKTREGLKNLFEITKWYHDKDLLINSVRLLKTEHTLSKYFLNGGVNLFYRVFKKFILQNLCGKSPRLFYLDLYKLGYFSRIRKKLKSLK